MKVLIVGAGGQGGPCASILSRDPETIEIRLADVDPSIAERVAAKIGSSKITTHRVDATKPEEVARLAKGVDVVIDLVMPWMASYVMRGALAAGAHYVNTAFDTPFWDEFVDGKELTLDREFKAAGKTALLGSGMAPGFINVIAKKYCDRMETIDSVKIRLGKKKTGGGPYDDIIKPWNPGWAPIQALKDCADSPICFTDGKYERVAPYDGIEEWTFPEPIGKLLVSHHSHEEPYSFPKNVGKGITYCDFKYYVAYHPAALVSLGLASDKEVDVKGIKIKPIDLVAAVLPKAGNAFFDEDPERFEYNDTHNFVSMMVEIKGTRGGVEKTCLIDCPNMNVPGKAIHDIFGTSLVNVALPAVTGARQIVGGASPGVIFAEQLDPDRFLELMKKTGYPYEWHVTEI